MERENIRDGVEFLWNDVACLNDGNCTFIITKTMVVLPKEKEDIDILQSASICDVLSEAKFQDDIWKLTGEMIVSVVYAYEEDKEDELIFAVPFEGEYQKGLKRGEYLQEKYIFAQALDERSFCLECVLAVPEGQKLQRDNDVQLRFDREDMVLLPAEWPKAEEIIGTKLDYRIDKTEDGYVRGKCYIGIIYADEDTKGEKVAYYEAEYPFEITKEDVCAEEIQYYSLTAQAVEDRKILVRSKNLLYGKRNETHFEPNIADAEVLQQPVQQEVLTTKEEQPIVKRTNRRKRLEKYMRDLNQGMGTSFVIRNIDLEKEEI